MVEAGGAAYLASLVSQQRAENPNNMLISAGDLTGASPMLSALLKDEPTIRIMNDMRLDLNVVGNHEFDFGRDELLRRIFNALHQNSIMIHGERRMGKTTLLYQLGQALRQADDPEWSFIPVSVDLEGTPQERLFHLLMEAIWGMLQAYLTAAPPELQFHRLSAQQYTDREFSADLREIIEALKPIVAPRQVRIILLIDEMDAIDGYERLIQLQLRRIFMSPLAENLGAVVAGIQISKAWDRLESPWYNMFIEFPLEPFDDAQARQLLVEPVQGVYEWAPDALDFVVAHADGRPYRLQQYALEAVNQMLNDGRTRITLADVQAADAVVEGIRTPKE
jgi:chromosomal replication initiation ATPase DnaA